MNYQTKLMQEILTNEKAQEIIDYVSQIYGDSYVALWFFQAIGSVLGPICDTAEQLKLETSPSTTSLLISYYEAEYGIQGDPTMTLEQRRNTVVAAMRSKGACTPARLASAVSAALGGVPVEVIEYDGTKIDYTEIDQIVLYGYRTGLLPSGTTSVTTDEIDDIVSYGIRSGQEPDETCITNVELDQIVTYGTRSNPEGYLGKNEFVVSVRGVVDSLAPATAVIERMKPAHLTYIIRGVTQESATDEIYVGTALTTAEHNMVTVHKILEGTSNLVTSDGNALVTSDGDELIAFHKQEG